MEAIRIDVGVCTAFTVKLSKVDFSLITKVIFTVKNFPSPDVEPIIVREFDKAEDTEIIVKPEESIKLREGAVYDFNMVLIDGTRHKMTDTGKIVLRMGVGDCIDD